MPTNWRIDTDMPGWMRSMEKRLMAVERRPVVQGPSDILGPGIDAFAAEVDDWNTEAATFNGFYYGPAGTPNAPDAGYGFLGHTMSRPHGYGVQRLYTAHDAQGALVKTGTGYVRQFFVPGGFTPRLYGTWQGIGTGWTNYVPTVGGFPIGGGWVRYHREGSVVDIAGWLIITGATGIITVSFPPGLSAFEGWVGSNYRCIGSAAIYDAGVGRHHGAVMTGGAEMSFLSETGGLWAPGIPITWGPADELSFTARYETVAPI